MNIFISYRREYAEDFARDIAQKLTDRGCSVFFDHDSLQTENGPFDERLIAEVENCDFLLMVISETTFKESIFKEYDENDPNRDYVRLELETAVKCKKSIIPISIHNCKFPPQMPSGLETIGKITTVNVQQSYFKESMNILYDRLGLEKNISVSLKGIISPLLMLIAVSILIGVTVTAFVMSRSDKQPILESENTVTESQTATINSEFYIESFYILAESDKQYYNEKFIFTGKSQAPFLNLYICDLTSSDKEEDGKERFLLASIETKNGEFRIELTGETWWCNCNVFELIPCDKFGNEIPHLIQSKEYKVNFPAFYEPLKILGSPYSISQSKELMISWKDIYADENTIYHLFIVDLYAWEQGLTFDENVTHIKEDNITDTGYLLQRYALKPGEYVITVWGSANNHMSSADYAFLTVTE